MIVDKIKKREPTAKRKENKVDIPVGKWVKCDKCKEIIYKETIRENMNICPNCGEKLNIFGKNEGEKFSKELEIDFLGEIPLAEKISESADSEKLVADDSSEISEKFNEIVNTIKDKYLTKD